MEYKIKNHKDFNNNNKELILNSTRELQSFLIIT